MRIFVKLEIVQLEISCCNLKMNNFQLQIPRDGGWANSEENKDSSRVITLRKSSEWKRRDFSDWCAIYLSLKYFEYGDLTHCHSSELCSGKRQHFFNWRRALILLKERKMILPKRNIKWSNCQVWIILDERSQFQL